MIFPEGTRSLDGQIGKFQRGVWILINKCDATVVPVGVAGSYDVWPPNAKPKLRGWIEAAAGETVSTQHLRDLGEEAGLALLKEKIESLKCVCQQNIDTRSNNL